MSLPGQLRTEELKDPSILTRWLMAFREWVVQSIQARPRVKVWQTAAVAGPSGTVIISSAPFRLGAVALASVQRVDAPLALTVTPFVAFAPATDGSYVVTYQFLPSGGQYYLVLLLVEA